jgi:hypothetical protein
MLERNFILEDNRAKLTVFNAEDYSNLVHFAIKEPSIWKYSFEQVAGAEHFRNYIDKAIEKAVVGTEIPLIVFDKSVSAVAGSSRFYDINITQKTIKIGYTWYGNAFQETGINRHVKFLMLSFAFEELEMERVSFEVNTQNEKSIRSLEKIGCQFEGILRSTHYNLDGSRRDSAVFSILQYEWISHTKNKIQSLLKPASE